MLSAFTKRKILKTIPFGVIWLVFGVLFLWVEYAALENIENTSKTAIQMQVDVVAFALTGITCIGLIIGFIEANYLNRLFENKSFLIKIISKFLIYAIFFMVVIFITFPIAASLELDVSVLDTRVWDKYFDFFYSITHISAASQLSFMLMVSLLYAEINDNLGQNVLLNFFTGKYHKPKSENRIFMFVDMKNSTTIAEKIGHKKYFELLRAYYSGFSKAIIKNYGEVYQYVGDEIVVTWKLEKGINKNYCVACFFDMKKDLFKEKDVYLKNYGVIPDFKAAIHFGNVTTGEIGALKKDIFFTGDVLNTTARILSVAANFNEDLLISGALSKKLNLPKNYKLIKKGETLLKGKLDNVEIVAVKKVN
ncbi:adenylate/guanylate cyclase domain-containing protein [Algibacter sp. PT7-4]|uniref:adenylate/guanylate cyclase domain-containing protein n=1 Tax=Algibacter ulvanivorans TaxID=3400999 RepID=UPI003AAD6475